MTNTETETLQRLTLATLDTINVAGSLGAPSTHLFLAMQTQGATSDNYRQFMRALKQIGYVDEQDDCFFLTDHGKACLTDLKRRFE